ncbi:MAG: AmmeMemoRadiSam system protein B [Betaproteobacteria bacterium CG2_30_68_42]|nr:MAG: AmmeMemoRadiSam system protein B [Betaproteobacteria bacterium CG2_30_68_42]
MNTIRPAAVAGMFYPADPAELGQEVDTLLDAAAAPAARIPKALIVPHAGYVYSGPIAASAYARLRHLHGRYARVALFGPAHRVYVRGLALPEADAFSTPLGDIAMDPEGVAAAAALPGVVRSAHAHALEHSLEVQLPFLQRALGSFTLVPLVVGEAAPGEIARVIETLAADPATLIVVSSDLSHYHGYAEARRLDAETAGLIGELCADLDHEQACGATPINGALLWARRRGLTAELLDLRNSGDTAGDRGRVVGYAAFAFYEDGHDEH